MPNMECPFCNIWRNEKYRILSELEHCFVIFSNPRLMKGHLLVIPKRHVEKLAILSPEELKEIISAVVEFQEKILARISSGCDIRQNCRPFQKQDDLKIDHVHFHLQPRELYDELYQKCQKFETDVFQKVDKIEQEIFDLLIS